MTRDIPIIFSAPMVLALLADRKTMTRRLAVSVRQCPECRGVGRLNDGPDSCGHCRGEGCFKRPSPWQKAKPGDRLWVRENFAQMWEDQRDDHTDRTYRYAATDERARDNGIDLPWRPSIHMPRSVSRLTLVVTAVKVEPLQAISGADAAAEGLWYCDKGDAAGFWFAEPEGTTKGVWGEGSVECYERLWDHLHGSGAWAENPEVVALSFDVHKTNIDTLKVAA